MGKPNNKPLTRYTKQERLKMEENFRDSWEARKDSVMECPSCYYRLMKKFWKKSKNRFDCPKCGGSLLDYKKVPEGELL